MAHPHALHIDKPAVVLHMGSTGLNAARQLAIHKVRVIGVTWDSADPGRRSRLCQIVHVPDVARDSQGAAAALLNVSVPLGTPLIAGSDSAVLFLQEHGDLLASRFSFYRLSPAIAGAQVDKKAQYQLVETAGVRIPRTFYPDSMEQLKSIAGQLRYPVFVKGHFGHLWTREFRNKGFNANSPDELADAFATVLSKKVQALVQEVIQGESGVISVGCHRTRDGRIAGLFTQRKIRQYPVDFGVGTLVESIRQPEVEEMATTLLHRIGYEGTAEVEFKLDAVDGTYKFIELNARLWQQHPLAAASGVDFPWLQYLELSGKPVPQMMQTKEGVRWLSLWEDLFAARILVRTGKLNLGEWVRSVTAVRTHNLWSPNDMHPPLGQYRDYIGSMLRKRWN